MATNVSERASALNDVLALLRAHAQATAEDHTLDPRHDLTDRVYIAGKQAALADITAAIGDMLASLWATNTSEGSGDTCATRSS
ncbi:hypothetical protein [Bifidobacterium criceti]|uniref:Uncharacterized protein n=1 Tax=Bifidobacterium criceti TaxID=1960969 RepID=A0A2A2EDW0_9BIFI|nr:hypothetical protein [Bifidobacterium criceti]PAU67201.1 hypothetical protein B1526_1285 [Bifidobacterium criceti]